MKYLLALSIILITNTAFAVDFQCREIGLEKVVKYLDYSSTEEFLSENDEIFFCKTKSEPYREIMQWGNGSALVGIEFEIQNGACVVVEEPYWGQDDQDGDDEWVEANCQ